MSEFKLKRRSSSFMMNPSEKRFHASDSLLFEFDFIKYLIEQEPTFIRRVAHLHASPNVTWRDVADEIHKLYMKQKTISNNPILLTCTIDHLDFVVSLTLKGAIKTISDQLDIYESELPREYAWFQQVDEFAKEMINIRDYEALGKEK